MEIRHLLDKPYILEAYRSGVSVQQIYRREQRRLAEIDPSIEFTHGAIVAFLRSQDDGEQNAPVSLPTYIYGKERRKRGAIPVYTGREVLDGDWLVIGDTHFPLEDTELIKHAVKLAKGQGITQLIVAGDIVQGDNASHWDKDTEPYPQSLETERTAEWAKWWCSQFDLVVWLPGNHDRWHLKTANGRTTFRGQVWNWLADINARSVENLMLTEYDRVLLKSGTEDWTVVHQAGYSRTGGAVAQKLITQFRTNVIVPHQHYSGVYYDAHGYNVGIEIGGMFGEHVFHYAELNTRPGNRVMTRGFATIINGQGTLYPVDDNRLAVRPIGA